MLASTQNYNKSLPVNYTTICKRAIKCYKIPIAISDLKYSRIWYSLLPQCNKPLENEDIKELEDMDRTENLDLLFSEITSETVKASPTPYLL